MVENFFKHKKSLGQNFLNSPHYLAAIVDAADVEPGEYILEVGPGEGALTAELLARGARVVAVEKDSRLIPLLKEKFAKEILEKRFELAEADALDFNPAAFGLENKKYKVVANIPYYITGALLKKFFSEKNRPSDVVLLMQKEVAERIARSKKESILSLSVKAYGTPSYIKTVPRGAFSPPPTVDSAILKITAVSRKNFKNSSEEEKFFALLHAGFGQKRKLLKRNLEKVLGTDAAAALQGAGIPWDARAEDVALERWLALTKRS